MVINFKLKPFCCALLAGLAVGAAEATAVRLETLSASVAQGNLFQARIVADIDAADAIIGFGFDLDAVTGLIFRGFSAGPGFADDPLYLAPFSDADGIRGASAGNLLTGTSISGNDVLLGLLQFEALSVGTATFGLGADDLAFNFTEGLIPLDPTIGNFLPAVAPLTIDVTPRLAVPEPSSLAYMVLALAALVGRASRREATPPANQPA